MANSMTAFIEQINTLAFYLLTDDRGISGSSYATLFDLIPQAASDLADGTCNRFYVPEKDRAALREALSLNLELAPRMFALLSRQGTACRETAICNTTNVPGACGLKPTRRSNATSEKRASIRIPTARSRPTISKVVAEPVSWKLWSAHPDTCSNFSWWHCPIIV